MKILKRKLINGKLRKGKIKKKINEKISAIVNVCEVFLVGYRLIGLLKDFSMDYFVFL